MKKKNSKPNILLVMADQMIPFLTGAYGNKSVKTPNMDKLVSEGVRFDSAYTPCPICAPARASMMTGNYISNHKVIDNAAPLKSDEPTFCHYLTAEGYDTVLSGKMHFIGPDQQHGFEKRLVKNMYFADFEWTMTREEGKARGYCASFYKNPIAIDYVNGGPKQYSQLFEYDEEAHSRGLEYIYSRRMEVGGTLQKPPKKRDNKPFFLCVSYNHPHEPLQPTKDLWDMYENEEIEIPKFPVDMEDSYSAMDKWLNIFHGVHKVDMKDKKALKNMRRAYYALVTYIDNKLGELLKALEDTGLKENTIIIFTSDHGDMLGEKGMVQKRSFYEYSCRIPLIIKFPGEDYSGLKVNQHVSLLDLGPTILDMAGISEKKRVPMDGKSLIPLLDNSDTSERVVYSEMHNEGVLETCFMIRKGKYKYIYINNNKPQLFDIENDPGEWKNLSGNPKYKDIEDDLQTCILNKFNPEKIEKEVRKDLQKRKVIKEAMKLTGKKWDYYPYFNASEQYWKDG